MLMMAMPMRSSRGGRWLAVDEGVTNVAQFVGSKTTDEMRHDKQSKMLQGVKQKSRYHCSQSGKPEHCLIIRAIPINENHKSCNPCVPNSIPKLLS
jgi:hypothetical protein